MAVRGTPDGTAPRGLAGGACVHDIAGAMTTHAFQADVTRLLELVVHSLYSNKEIFLRELVSNAADALDKLRFRAVTEPALMGDVPLGITLRPDAEKKTLAIEDTGIGMTEEELVKLLGTVAHSGTRELFEKLKAAGEAKDLSLIGQFGVGFYSSFLVASRVDVISRAAGQEKAFKWSSDAKSEFTVVPVEEGRATHGTTIVLHLKPEHEEFLEPWRLRTLVERYSDYVPHPVSVVTKDKDGNEEAKVANRATALWQRPKSEITDEQYDELYAHIAHDFEKPLARSHFKIEGTLEFAGLLYLPRRAPNDLFDPNKSKGLRLFVKRVLIMDDCQDLLPPHLRFVRGLVDSDDLPLNVSREILQDSSTLRAIKKQVTKRALDMIEDLSKSDAEAFLEFSRTFGAVLKEGAAMGETDEKLVSLLRFESTKTGGEGEAKMISLDDYVARMPEGQSDIYFLHGTSRASLLGSPYLEALTKKGYEVLLLTDAVDEFCVAGIQKWKDKPLTSAQKADIHLGESDDEKKAREERSDKLKALVERATKVLEGRVKEVKLSDRLTDSPSCLALGPGGTPLAVEAMLRAAGRPVPPSPRIFELNGTHPLVEKLGQRAQSNADDEVIAEYIEVLYDQAKLAEGGVPDDPGLYGRRVAKLLSLGV